MRKLDDLREILKFLKFISNFDDTRPFDFREEFCDLKSSSKKLQYFQYRQTLTFRIET